MDRRGRTLLRLRPSARAPALPLMAPTLASGAGTHLDGEEEDEGAELYKLVATGALVGNHHLLLRSSQTLICSLASTPVRTVCVCVRVCLRLTHSF